MIDMDGMDMDMDMMQLAWKNYQIQSSGFEKILRNFKGNIFRPLYLDPRAQAYIWIGLNYNKNVFYFPKPKSDWVNVNDTNHL